MRKPVLIAVFAINLVAVVLVWKTWHDRAQARAFISALPTIPDLTGWRRVFVDRVRLDTDAVAQGFSFSYSYSFSQRD